MSGALNLNADEMEILGCTDEHREVGVSHTNDSVTLYRLNY